MFSREGEGRGGEWWEEAISVEIREFKAFFSLVFLCLAPLAETTEGVDVCAGVVCLGRI